MTTAPHPSHPRRRRRAIAGAFFLGLALSVARAEPPAATRVVTDQVRTETVPQFRELPGELRAAMHSTVAARQAGLVVQINVEPGGKIESGKVLAKLDDRFARLEVAKAEAQVAIRRAAVTERQALLDKGKRNTQRYEAAFKASGVTENELDEARTAQIEAEARLSQAQAELIAGEAELGMAKERFQDMTIRAPFTGVVAAKRAEAGEWVTQGAPVLDLVASESFDAWMEVPEDLTDDLRAGRESGTPIHVRIPPAPSADKEAAPAQTGGVFAATVAAIIPASDPTTKATRVRARMEDPTGHLQPGIRVIGLVPTGQHHPALTVLAGAVHQRDGDFAVVFDSNGIAAVAPVAVLGAHGDRLVVTSRILKEGMDVVVNHPREIAAGQNLAKTIPATPDAPVPVPPGK